MNELIFAWNTVSPLLLLMACGFIAKRTGLLTDLLVKGINQLVFRIFLPINLFCSILNMPDDLSFSGLIFILVPAGLIFVFLSGFLIIPRIEKDPKKIGAMIQAIGRSNYAIFGIPLVNMLFPGQDTSLASLMVVVTVPIYNVLSVIALSVYSGSKVSAKRILLNIIKNPLIISVLSGFVFWLIDFAPPKFLDTTLTDLSKIATPLALFTLGGSIRLTSTRKHIKQLSIGVLGKIVVSPLLFVSLSALLGLRGVALICVFIAFGAPTAVSSYPMAQQMGADGELAAEQVALSSAFSILTTFLFVFALKSLQLI